MEWPIPIVTDDGIGGLWLDVYLIYAKATICIVLWCLCVRCAFDASPLYLARTRCYELPPLRLIFHGCHIAIWLAFVAAFVVSVRYGWAYCKTSDDQHGFVFLAACGVVLLAGLGGWATLVWLINVPDNCPPTAMVRGVETAEGIGMSHLASLGREQFPEMLAYGHTSGLWVRRGLMLIVFAYLAVVIAASTDWGRANGLHAAGVEVVRLARWLLPPAPGHWAVVAGVSAGLGILLLLLENHSYTLVRFPQSLLAGGVLVLVVWSCAALLDTSGQRLVMLACGLGLAFAARWATDLSRAARFTRARSVLQPIAGRIADEVPDLAGLKSRPDCRLAPLDEVELRDRITRGCRNVEEASPLVTRNMARFLSLVRIEYDHFCAAMLRYLTVRRFVTTARAGGTPRMLQHPVVPMWNEELFPFHPPAGYRNLLAPLGLGWEWDIVQRCSSCSGSGKVSCGCSGGTVYRTETYTEISGGQTVTRTREKMETCGTCGGSGMVTCSSCSGHGKELFHQTLNTQWQRLLPTCSAPHVRIPELLEDAEERTYFRVPLVEDRNPLVLLRTHDALEPDLVARLSQGVLALSAELPEFARLVEQMHDGIVYRADFQVTGFWVLRIGFRRLPGKVGWFFGCRPEFHFPALSLSWAVVSTVMFVLPFITMMALLTVMLVSVWMRNTLPLLP